MFWDGFFFVAVEAFLPVSNSITVLARTVYVGYINCWMFLGGNVIKIQIHTKADKLVDNVMCVVVHFLQLYLK